MRELCETPGSRKDLDCKKRRSQVFPRIANVLMIWSTLRILSPTDAWISFSSVSQRFCWNGEDLSCLKKGRIIVDNCRRSVPRSWGRLSLLHKSIRLSGTMTPLPASSTKIFSQSSQSSESKKDRNHAVTSARRYRIHNCLEDNNISLSQHQRNRNKNRNLLPMPRQNSILYMFRTAKNMERQGRWGEALTLLDQILQKDPKDAHSHLAMAKLEARREGKISHQTTTTNQNLSKHQITPSRARKAFENGTCACPQSVHLWQGWAIYEQSRGNVDKARELFEKALILEPHNSYVCHAYSLMERKLGNDDRAVELIERALYADNANVTAALVCSLGEWLIASGKHVEARELYSHQLPRLTTEKDRVEVYLASAWLEERHSRDLVRAKELLERALAISPTSSLANVALARLEGRIQAAEETSGQNQIYSRNARLHNKSAAALAATAQRLASICEDLYVKGTTKRKCNNHDKTFDRKRIKHKSAEDGRIFNALATLEIKQRKFHSAREVLRKGRALYPYDHNLLTAAGKVEEHLGNHTAARQFYGESLKLEPSAPTLVAYALLELNHPSKSGVSPQDSSTSLSSPSRSVQANFTLVKGLFEEAILLDPRNGPAYNAYGNAEARRGAIKEARSVFQRGVQANCSDAASIYHGYGMLELSLGNVDEARTILQQGLESVRQNQDMILSDIPHRDRARFLSHTLGMLELNSNRPAVALEIFQEGIERCGNTSRLLLGAALSEMRLGKDDAARRLFERSVVADKRHAEAWQAWGAMETRAGQFKKASLIFQNGIKNAPRHGSLWHGYASLELKRENVMNARTLFAAGIKKSTRRHYALFQGWAMLELREGNYQAARKLISEALTRNKKNGRGWIIAAQIEKQDGHHSGLVSLLLRRGIECDPSDAELYRELGEYLVSQGKIEDAREVFEKGMEVNPMYAPLYHSMAELEARICNLDGLAKLNKRAAELFNQNALEPAPLASGAFGTKIKAKQSRYDKRAKGDKPISAFATRIVDDDDHDKALDGNLMGLVGSGVIALSILESLNGDGLVGDMMNVETIDPNE
jgi:tetratricopeptide (TPR) repeat protein